ncbi:helix-turn-helix domain-containing protein [Chitinophaga nivalis]|uniref:Transcriptional regulator n=1 Tax=Chitinophaga nivalis TaxID=2991709 RepID=A0ABT3ITJ4_9BACT|nr:transcriptional regulator [Chitinophaga nivalis]MCW3463017.1 transcriptional regulator [Chitinophaga nivalis]MCW3487293.1 transcriptional regulator [Chitinophaga nivalis]
MGTLKYKVITSKSQYKAYCDALEQLVFAGAKDRNTKDEIALLTLLIEKWDDEHILTTASDPVQLLHAFMRDHDLKAKDLVTILSISKGYVSDILHYKKGLSKEVIRKLADYFKVSQEAFNRPYKLKGPDNSHLKNAAAMYAKKRMPVA